MPPGSILLAKKLFDLRFGQIGDPNDFIGFIAKNFNIDCPQRVSIQDVKGAIGPLVQKNMDQLPLIIAGLSLCRYAPSLILFFPLLVFFLFVPFIPALLGPRKIPILFFLVASSSSTISASLK